jgi:hypothetical protein
LPSFFRVKLECPDSLEFLESLDFKEYKDRLEYLELTVVTALM